jgi:UDPglucose 6-dehydrogenase
MLPGVELAADAYAAMDGADALVIVTEWNQFRSLQLDRVKKLMKAPVVVDLRNVYSPADMAAAGFDYHSIGRPRTAKGTGAGE